MNLKLEVRKAEVRQTREKPSFFNYFQDFQFLTLEVRRPEERKRCKNTWYKARPISKGCQRPGGMRGASESFK